MLKVDPQNFRAKWDVVRMNRNLAYAVSLAGRNKDSLEILENTLERAEEISKETAITQKISTKSPPPDSKQAKLTIR